MTSLVRRYLKTAMLFLVAGLGIGGWMIVQREFTSRPVSAYLTSAHTHAILVGFVMMTILGVAQWMFPRPARDDTRYRPKVAEYVFWTVATGTAVRVVTELMRASSQASLLRVIIVASGVAQVLGLLMFIVNMWSRIRGVGSTVREAGGERF